jgi:hypothetical protein
MMKFVVQNLAKIFNLKILSQNLETKQPFSSLRAVLKRAQMVESQKTFLRGNPKSSLWSVLRLGTILIKSSLVSMYNSVVLNLGSAVKESSIWTLTPNFPGFHARSRPDLKPQVIFWAEGALQSISIKFTPETLKKISFGAKEPENPLKMPILSGPTAEKLGTLSHFLG